MCVCVVNWGGDPMQVFLGGAEVLQFCGMILSLPVAVELHGFGGCVPVIHIIHLIGTSLISLVIWGVRIEVEFVMGELEENNSGVAVLCDLVFGLLPTS